LLYPVLLDIFIISDAELYFKKAWNNSWNGIDKESIAFYKTYGVNIEKYLEMYNFDIF
jgi:hypothetical protein